MYRAVKTEYPLTRQDICSRLNITSDQWRYWVRQGLLPKRTSRRHPKYTHDDIARAKLIRDTLAGEPDFPRTLADLRDRLVPESAHR